MSLTVFMALCILGIDFLIYAFFHRIYGDKRSAVARQVAAFKGQSPNHVAYVFSCTAVAEQKESSGMVVMELPEREVSRVNRFAA